MPEIFSVSPGRGRAGDPALAINGAGFAPSSPFGNSVEFEGNIASVSSQDETDISVPPPGCSGGFGLCVTDKWIMLAVQRKDTFEWTTFRWWIKADLADLKTASGLTEKIPTGEDLDDPTNDCLTAATWNRLVTFVEFLAHEVLTAKGSVMTRDGVGIAEVLVGVDGLELRRVPAGEAQATGLRWGKPKRVWTLRWGRGIDAANVRNGAMRANGAADDAVTGVKAGTHVQPRNGVLRHLTVNVESASGGDTLDQVVVIHNLGSIHDSGTGLAIGADGAYQVDLGEWRVARDIEVRAFKTGTAATMELTATLTIEEEDRPATGDVEDTIADAVAVSDSIAAEVILGTDPLEDAISVSDSLAIELQVHVELADVALVADALEVETVYHRELADTIDAHDSIEAVLL